jgi:hypothetical protein
MFGSQCAWLCSSIEHARGPVGWVRFRVIAAALLAACIAVPCQAADISDWVSFNSPRTDSLLNSVFAFGGRMSTTTFGDTLVFNTFPLATPLVSPSFDNYIIGTAYQRELYRYRGFVLGGEIGLADRFGNYAQCCSPVVLSSSILNSGELWFGPAFRYDAIVLFNQLRVIPGMTFGFSATTNSIGVEREREITNPGNARLLGYLGPEIAFSTLNMSELELVISMHHRSGADHTFGNFGEGYNANVVGLRYRF